ncbi:MAG: hypothetical protein ABNH38_20915 [Tateyamaria sp.]|jgi:hypothetical protein|uniref:hypothetical protein n=1 Tax=Tateyamaria sp. TaxID=1929288 RepID=UPI0032DD653F
MALLRTCLAVFALTVLALPAQAELSTSDAASIEATKGLRLLSSDGAVIGVADGISVNNDRVYMFLLAKGGSIFAVRSGGKDIVVQTKTRLLTLQGNDLILDASAQQIRNEANMSFTDDSSPIEIVLFKPI